MFSTCSEEENIPLFKQQNNWKPKDLPGCRRYLSFILLHASRPLFFLWLSLPSSLPHVAEASSDPPIFRKPALTTPFKRVPQQGYDFEQKHPLFFENKDDDDAPVSHVAESFHSKSMDTERYHHVLTDPLFERSENDDEMHNVSVRPNLRFQDQNDDIDRITLTMFPSKLQGKMTGSGGASSSLSLPGVAANSASLHKTGTTIAGCLAENGKFVVLAADSRATTDQTLVADRTCNKIHPLFSFINDQGDQDVLDALDVHEFDSDQANLPQHLLAKGVHAVCCGAGTSGDIDALVRNVRYTFALRHSIDTAIGNNLNDNESRRERPQISAICKHIRNQLFRSQGNLGVNLILGGYDDNDEAEEAEGSAVLVALHPHGSMDVVPYSALGSGGLAAMSVLESTYRPNLSVSEAIEVVTSAVRAGVENDLGSGSCINVCVVGKQGSKFMKSVVKEEVLSAIREKEEKETRAMVSDGGVNGFGNLPYEILRSTTLFGVDSGETRSWAEGVLQL